MNGHSGNQYMILQSPDIPAEIIGKGLTEAQEAVDKASKRRGIDFFELHDNPIGLLLE